MFKSLNQGWHISNADKTVSGVRDVPAMVLDVLVEQNVIPDPYKGENEWIAYEALKQDFVFENTFTLSAEDCQEDQLLLRCEGLDTVAKICINGTEIASVNDMHRTFSFDIKNVVHPGENRIVIFFHSGLMYALEQHEKEPYYTTSDTVDGFSLVRKSHSNYGWDWGPRLPDIGIWRSISVIGYRKAKIEDLLVRQEHNDAVTLQFETQIATLSPCKDLSLTFTLTAPDGTQQTLTVSEEQLYAPCCLTVENPKLWWCRGLGEQNLYNLSCKLSADGEVVDTKEMRIGLRTLTVKREKDQWGESFAFTVNGVSVFAMGANYIPEDSFYSRCSKERTASLLQQCVKANYNAIRVWGGGYFCEDYFYDLCDEYGLMVWQDLLFACGVYRLHDDFVENVVAETKDNLRRLRHHPSIALWCGNNELEWGWSGWDMGFGDKLSDKADYLKLFEWILPRAAKEVDPDRFYWLASPSSGGSFDDPNDQNRGDVHYWDVWHRLKHFTEYRKYFFRFCSEFGFQSFPSEKTIATFAEEKDRNIFSPVMENHQKNGGANGLIMYYLASYFRYPTSFSKLLYVSQILQAEAIRYGVEHWRSNRGRCMGALYWQVNDCWPVASWSSLDYYNRWKPLHYYAKKFYAPLMLAAAEEKGMITFTLSNETMHEQAASVSWKLRDFTGAVLQEGNAEVVVPALSVNQCGVFDCSAVAADRYAPRKCYVEYVLIQNGEEISRDVLLLARPKQIDFPDPQIVYQAEEKDDRFVLCFSTETMAKYVWLDAADFDFVADDNCFDLTQGHTKHVTILKADITKEGKPYLPTLEEMNNLQIVTAFDIG
jgi:beta-mannosidase